MILGIPVETLPASSDPGILPIASLVSLVTAVLTLVIRELFQRHKTQAEADQLIKSGDSDLMGSASEFLQQSGEFGRSLMERITQLEAAVTSRDDQIRELQTDINDLKIKLGNASGYREQVADLRAELAGETARREAAEADVVRLEAIIVAAQVQVGEDWLGHASTDE